MIKNNFEQLSAFRPEHLEDVAAAVHDGIRTFPELQEWLRSEAVSLTSLEGGTIVPTYLVSESGTETPIAVVKAPGDRKIANGQWSSELVPKNTAKRAYEAFGIYEGLTQDIDWLPPKRFIDERFGNGLLYMSHVSGDLWQKELDRGVFDKDVASRIGRILGTLTTRSWNNAGDILDAEDTRMSADRLFANKVVKVLDAMGAEPDLYEAARVLREKRYGDCHMVPNPSPKNWIVSDKGVFGIDFDSAMLEHSPARGMGELTGSMMLGAYEHPERIAELNATLRRLWDGFFESLAVPELVPGELAKDGVGWSALYLLYRSKIKNGPDRWKFGSTTMLNDAKRMINYGEFPEQFRGIVG